MCGIAGILIKRGKGIDARWLKTISRALQQRGPDDAGFLGWSPSIGGAVVTREPSQLNGASIAFVHRRLSILDLSEAGWQPMQSDDCSCSIVFNGEIYNYVELRFELEKLGHTFHSQSDTEVLLKAYIQWGAQALQRLVGMFAFAVLDQRRDVLFLARDFFGIKPLYYYQSEDAFGFASETNTLLEFPGVVPRVNAHRLFPYLRFGITDYGGETLWHDIYQLPAAHYLEIPIHSHMRLSPSRYWGVPPYEPQAISYDEAASRLRDMLLDSIRLHLRSDVPVGACLSGGLDSSAIVMAMRRVLGNTGKIHTFSHLTSDQSLNEEPWIDIVVRATQATPHCICPSETDLLTSLEDILRCQGEPFAGTSIFAQYKVFEMAGQQNMKVMLDGQGADEMLGGYWNFLGARIASLSAQWRIIRAAQLFVRACRFPDISAVGLAALVSGTLATGWLEAKGRKLINRDLLLPWLNHDWFRKQSVGIVSPLRRQGPNHLRSQLVDALNTVSLPMLLRYEDRNSMRFSIESRVPFLTSQIAEFLLSLPEAYIIDQHGTRKSIFRSAMRGLVPDPILDRRDKIGFAVPENQWMRALQPWVAQCLNSEAAHAIPALNLMEAKRCWQNVLSGSQSDRSFTWRWINLIEWTRLFNVHYDT